MNNTEKLLAKPEVTQVKLSELFGLTQPLISRWKSGKAHPSYAQNIIMELLLLKDDETLRRLINLPLKDVILRLNKGLIDGHDTVKLVQELESRGFKVHLTVKEVA